jgi:hypothetical protein
MQYLKKHSQPHDVLYLNNSAHPAYGYYGGYYGLNIQTPLTGLIVEYINYIPPVFDFSRDVVFRRYLYNREGYAIDVLQDGLTQNSLQERPGWEEMRYNKRTWLIFSHFPAMYQEKVLDYFNKEGHKWDEFHAPGASIYLYDLSKTMQAEE